MCYIEKKISKNEKEYYVLVCNGIYVSFDYIVITKVAMSVGVSNINLNDMQIGDKIMIGG